MNPSPASAAAAANHTAPSPPPPSSQPLTQQLLPSVSTPSTTSATALPLKKPSTQSTVRPATDHHWYNKQIAAAPFPQPTALNSSSPNSTGNVSSLNLQLQLLNQQAGHGLMHPIGTSSRGFTPNPNVRPGAGANGDRSAGAAAFSLQQLGRPDVMSNQQMQFLKSGYLNHSHPGLVGGSTALQGYPVTSYPKGSFSATERNGIREARSKDEALTMVLNRKVRVSEGSSLYSLCRSWLKNGCHDQSQQKNAARYSCLPRPLPTPAQTHINKSNDDKDIEEDDKEDEKSVEQLSTEDLLQRHIKRARRVRSRLREERMHRITRYKNRLATLLPTPVEALRDETPAGN
ncbi:unnamed protein product [Rhodiola kirilowii]